MLAEAILRTELGWCTLHRIAYNRTLDPSCPQCTLSGHAPYVQLDFDKASQKPQDAAGKLLDAADILPQA